MFFLQLYVQRHHRTFFIWIHTATTNNVKYTFSNLYCLQCCCKAWYFVYVLQRAVIIGCFVCAIEMFLCRFLQIYLNTQLSRTPLETLGLVHYLLPSLLQFFHLISRHGQGV